jgi:hypothetical protein
VDLTVKQFHLVSPKTVTLETAPPILTTIRVSTTPQLD